MKTDSLSWQAIHKKDGVVWIDLRNIGISRAEDITYKTITDRDGEFKNEYIRNEIKQEYDYETKTYTYTDNSRIKAVLQENNEIEVKGFYLDNEVEGYIQIGSGTYSIKNRKSLEELFESRSMQSSGLTEVARNAIQTVRSAFDNAFLESTVSCLDVELTPQEILNMITKIVYPTANTMTSICISFEAGIAGNALIEIKQLDTKNDEQEYSNKLSSVYERVIGTIFSSLIDLHYDEWLPGHKLIMRYGLTKQETQVARERLAKEKVRDYFKQRLKID